MRDEELAAIREREEKATPGPWFDNSYGVLMAVVPEDHPWNESFPDEPPIAVIAWMAAGENQSGDAIGRSPEARANMQFIEHAREDIPALLAENAALREIVEAVAKVPVIASEYTGGYGYYCIFCEEAVVGEATGDPERAAQLLRHHPDCPVTKARALLGTVDAK